MKHLFFVLIILMVLLGITKFIEAGEIVFRNGPRSIIVCYPRVYYNTYRGYSSGYYSGYSGGYYYQPSYHGNHRRYRRNLSGRYNNRDYSYYPVTSRVDLDRVQNDRYYIQ